MRSAFAAMVVGMVLLAGCRKEAGKDVEPAAGSPEQRAQDSVRVVADSIAKADSSRAPSSLGGTRWRLFDYESASYKREAPAPGTAYTIDFSGDGQATVLADCNRATGTWSSQRKNGLTFGPLAATTAACREGSMSDQFLRDLAQVQGYQLVDGRLFLTIAGSGGVYQFIADEGPPPLMETIDPTKGRFAFQCADSTGAMMRMVANFVPHQVSLRLGRRAVVLPATSGTRGHFESKEGSLTVRAHDADLVWQGRSYQCGDLPVPE